MDEVFQLYCGFANRKDLLKNSFVNSINELKKIKIDGYPLSGWDKHWARRWEFPFVYQAIKHILKDGITSGKVLESGSGITRVPLWIAKEAKEVVGVDLDESLMKKWEKIGEENRLNINFVKGDMLNLPFDDGKFDLSYSISAIEHTGDAPKAVSEMIRVTKSGGGVVFTMDIDIKNSDSVPAHQFDLVQKILEENCVSYAPYRFFSPTDLLTFNNRTVDPQSNLKIGLKNFMDTLGISKLKEQTIFAFIGLKK